MIRFYKDGDRMCMLTDEQNESDFLRGLASAFDEMICRGHHISLAGDPMLWGGVAQDPGSERLQEELRKPNGEREIEIHSDWEFQFEKWLPQIVDICCKYRGYKNSVIEKKVLMSGDIHQWTNRPAYYTHDTPADLQNKRKGPKKCN
jgi:hypothetical protein